MKILWHSNSSWSRTGYGSQTRLTVPRLIEQGHDVAISAFYGLEGAVEVIDGVKNYPKLVDGYGNDVIHAHARDHFGGMLEDGLILTLLDVWVLNAGLFRAPVKSAAWVPVDHDPAPPSVKAFFAQSDCVPIAMSRFGERMLAEYDPLYVPHSIDTSVFKDDGRAEGRELIDFPEDAFVVGMVAANKGNPSRKSFPEAIRAFAELRKVKKDACLYIHAEASGMYQGVNLPNLLAHLELPPECVHFPDQYQLQVTGFTDQQMAKMYSAFDVLLNPATGEGFGVPIIEAQACGTPVIVTGNSAMTEVGEVGWHVGGQNTWTYLESWQTIPDVGELTDALIGAYDQAPRMRSAARAHAEQYDLEIVVRDFWVPALAALEERFAEREPSAVAA